MNLKGRDFLTLKDFSKEEIMYLIDLAAELKDKKKKGIPVDHHRGKNVKRPAQEPAAPLRWRHMTLAWVQPILIRQAHRLAGRRALPIRREF